jgi:hypothetical protein
MLPFAGCVSEGGADEVAQEGGADQPATDDPDGGTVPADAAAELRDGGADGGVPRGGSVVDGGRAADASVEKPALGTLCATALGSTTCWGADAGSRVRVTRTVKDGNVLVEAVVETQNYLGSGVTEIEFRLAGSVPDAATLPRTAASLSARYLLLPQDKCEHEPWSDADCVDGDTVDGTFTQSMCEGHAEPATLKPSDPGLTIRELSPNEVWATFSGTLAVDLCYPRRHHSTFCDFDPNARLSRTVCDAQNKCYAEFWQAAHCIDHDVPLQVTMRLAF